MTGSTEFTFYPLSAKKLLIFLLLAVPHASQAQDARLPSSPGAIFSEREGPTAKLPLWISLEELTARGERFETTNLLDSAWDLTFLSEEIQRKRREHSLSESTCPVYKGFSVPEHLDGRSVRTLQLGTETSLAVFTARIKQTAPGFMLGAPNTLLTLSDISILSNRGRLDLPDPLYVPFHRANFSFDGFSFCAQALYSRKMYIPSIDDRLMVFLLDPPIRNLLLAHPYQLIILPRDASQPLLPKTLMTDPMVPEDITQDELLSAVRQMASQR